MVSTGKMLAFINALGGGAAAPSEVVILPETVTTVDDGRALITTPLQAPVAAGDTVSITYNGAPYECTGVAGDDDSVMFGNLSAIGFEAGNPDAPFVVALFNGGVDFTGDGSVEYGAVMPMDGSTTIALSIVQVGAASGGGSASAGGGVFRVVCENGTPTGDIGNGAMMGLIYTPDKTGPDILSAFNSGEHVFIDFINPLGDGGTIRTPVVFAKDGAIEAGALSNGVSVVGRITWDDAGTTIRFEVYPPA